MLSRGLACCLGLEPGQGTGWGHPGRGASEQWCGPFTVLGECWRVVIATITAATAGWTSVGTSAAIGILPHRHLVAVDPEVADLDYFIKALLANDVVGVVASGITGIANGALASLVRYECCV